MQLELSWPVDLPVNKLRPWLRDQLAIHGHPLRWAITAIEPVGDHRRQLKIEAVLLNVQGEGLTF